MFDGLLGAGGDQVPGSAPSAEGRQAVRGDLSSRPWLAEDRCFQDVIASLPGGPVLAQVLPALLALEPAQGEVGPESTVVAGAGESAGQETRDDLGDGESWPGAFGGSPDASAGSGAEGPAGPAAVESASGSDRAGSALGMPDGLPVWFTALQQCWEPSPTVERVPVAVGSAPRVAGRLPVGGLVDPARAVLDEEYTVDSLAQMPTTALVEVVAAFKRVEAWAAAQAAQAAAMLAGRDELRPCDQRTVPAGAGGAVALTAPALATTTLAKRLATTEHTAGRLVRTGLALSGVLHATGEALAVGAIDWAKAQVLATALAGAPWYVAQAVEDEVLPTAGARTPGQLREAAHRALIGVDPADAARRHTRARAERRVERPVPLPDGMALVRAVLPADAAVRLDATLQAAAKHAKTTGDTRTTDQLRADALDALTTHVWQLGAINPTGRDRPGCAPGAHAPGGPADDDRRGSPGTCGSGPDAFATLLGPHAEGTPTGCLRLAHVGKRAQINVTVDLTTLLGLNQNPGTLSGYGPISADMARALARDATWRRLITDPVTGMVIDVATPKYRPPANLDELVRLRYPTCVDPVCSVPSHRCDLDHLDEWTTDNPDTSAPNLAPLCRTHHLHKTHAGVAYTQIDPGVGEATTPTGHRYRYRTTRDPDPHPPGSDPDDPPPPF